MEEARKSIHKFSLMRFFRGLAGGLSVGAPLRNQRGQAFLEYMLVLLLSLAFLRFVFFNREYGLKANLDRTMLRLGSFLELNLKTGTKPGEDGVKSLDAFAGTNRWRN